MVHNVVRYGVRCVKIGVKTANLLIYTMNFMVVEFNHGQGNDQSPAESEGESVAADTLAPPYGVCKQFMNNEKVLHVYVQQRIDLGLLLERVF